MTSEYFDKERFAAILADQQIDRIFESLRKGKEKLSAKFTVKFGESYKKNLIKQAESVRKIRTILSPMQQMDIEKFYIPLSVDVGRKTIENADLESIMKQGQRIHLVGTGGSGKTILLRRMFFDALKINYGIPFYLELKKIGDYEDDTKYYTVMEGLADTLSGRPSTYQQELLEEVLSKKDSILLLDALDEVPVSRRSSVESEILEIAARFPKARIVVSSRPSDRFVMGGKFSRVSPARLTDKQAHALCEMAPIAEDIKEEFAKDLAAGMFKASPEVLDTPLMAIIMIKTYGHIPGVPKKKYEFYTSAYTALSETHDRTKNEFRSRETNANLHKDDLHRILCATAYFSYEESRYALKHDELLHYIEKAKKYYSRTGIPTESIIQDFTEYLCFLIKDGDKYEFVHRSFQEYFSAFFIRMAAPEAQPKFLRKISDRASQDLVVLMLWEMQPEIVEVHLLMPFMKNLFDKVRSKRLPHTKYRSYLDVLGAAYIRSETVTSHEINVRGESKMVPDVVTTGFALASRADENIVSFIYDNYINTRRAKLDIRMDKERDQLDKIIRSDPKKYKIISTQKSGVRQSRLLDGSSDPWNIYRLPLAPLVQKEEDCDRFGKAPFYIRPQTLPQLKDVYEGLEMQERNRQSVLDKL